MQRPKKVSLPKIGRLDVIANGIEVPRNPFDKSPHVATVSVPGQKTASVADDPGGWQYDQSTGDVWPNNAKAY
jgi:hypothetical protein